MGLKKTSAVLSSRSNGWGGARRGAGRPAAGGRRLVAHASRGMHRESWPVLVTLRACWRSLRTQYVFPTVRGAIADAAAARPSEFRVCEFSVQGDHIHLIVEARDARALSRGINGLCVRLAKRVNRLFFEHGPFFVGRHHRVPLKTPRAVRNALRYVLANFRKHGRGRPGAIDPYSSAPYFCGFAEFTGRAPFDVDRAFVPRVLSPPSGVPRQAARTWLLAVGWLQAGGRLSITEQPRS